MIMHSHHQNNRPETRRGSRRVRSIVTYLFDATAPVVDRAGRPIQPPLYAAQRAPASAGAPWSHPVLRPAPALARGERATQFVAMLPTPPRATAAWLVATAALASLLGAVAAIGAMGAIGSPFAPGATAPVSGEGIPWTRGVATPDADPALRAADSLVAARVASGGIPGAVLVVSRNGERVLEKAYGHAQLLEYGQGEYGVARADRSNAGLLAHLPDPVPMTTSTAFDLASVTKVVATTFAAMLLVDRGQLDVDAPVRSYLPDFRGGGKDNVTLRHLLAHVAGLQQWVPVQYHASHPDEAYAHVRDLPLGWPVAEGRHYSDLGFMVLGRVVEEIAGEPLDRFLGEELFGPLGLRHTGFRRSGSPLDGPIAATSHGNPYEHRMVHDSTFGYLVRGDALGWDGWRRYTLVGEVNDGNAWHAWGGVAGHAGLFSTGRELAVLVQLLLDGGVHGGRRYLRTETIETFLQPVVEGQALGWQLPSYAPPGSFAHTGFTGTWVLGVPSRRLVAVLLTNRQNLGLDERGLYPDLGALQRAVATALVGPDSR